MTASCSGWISFPSVCQITFWYPQWNSFYSERGSDSRQDCLQHRQKRGNIDGIVLQVKGTELTVKLVTRVLLAPPEEIVRASKMGVLSLALVQHPWLGRTPAGVKGVLPE